MRVCRTFLRICMRECVFVCVFAYERGGACERKRERERGTRNGNDLAREVPRKRVMIYIPRCRYDDRAIGGLTKKGRKGESARTAENV